MRCWFEELLLCANQTSAVADVAAPGGMVLTAPAEVVLDVA